jgi:hypothetical protein
MKHWRHGYGFAFDVNHSEKKPYLVCFASGSAKRCALPDFLTANSLLSIPSVARGRTSCVFCLTAGGLRRYTANKLTRKFTIETRETRAWAVPSVHTLPQVLKGVHVFHCWLGCAQVIEIHEVQGWPSRLTDRISRFHVRRIQATARIGPHVAALKCGLVRRCEHHTGRSAYPKLTRSHSAQPRSRMFGACASQRCRQSARESAPLSVHASRHRCLCEPVNLELAMPCEAPDGSLLAPSIPVGRARRSVPQRYSVVFQNGLTTMLTAHALLTV